MERKAESQSVDAEQVERIRSALAVVLGKYEGGDLPAALRELDTCAGEVSGHLQHYLSKRSYAKAWEFLEGGHPEAGICGRKA
jgi:hypothetical protein